ncbi:MAG: hypothetical protein ABF535_10595, partial [Acetobacter sp.]
LWVLAGWRFGADVAAQGVLCLRESRQDVLRGAGLSGRVMPWTYRRGTLVGLPAGPGHRVDRAGASTCPVCVGGVTLWHGHGVWLVFRPVLTGRSSIWCADAGLQRTSD